MKKMIISTEQESYPLFIGTGIINDIYNHLINAGIRESSKLLIITDTNVAPIYLDKVKAALKEANISTYIVDAGEQAKSLNQAEKIISFAINQGLDRTSTIIALGGGVVGDLAGFVSAVYMRGISFVQLPTTILAHDSSVGGKVAINHPLGKNLIGAFHQPKLVFFDTSFLTTLPKREVQAGLAEVIKHGLIADKDFADWLLTNANYLLNLDLAKLNEAIYLGIQVKAAIVKQDERENGNRALLNYGHTLAHVIENISKYTYLHGEAVAIGMVYASKLAMRLGITSEHVVNYTAELISKFNLPTVVPDNYNTSEMLNIMMRDKKFKDNQARMVLPIKIGDVIIQEGIDKKIITEVLDQFKNTDRI